MIQVMKELERDDLHDSKIVLASEDGLSMIKSLLFPHTAVQLDESEGESIVSCFTCRDVELYLTNMGFHCVLAADSVTALLPKAIQPMCVTNDQGQKVTASFFVKWQHVVRIGLNLRGGSFLVVIVTEIEQRKKVSVPTSYTTTLATNAANAIDAVMDRDRGEREREKGVMYSSGGTIMEELSIHFKSLHEAQWFVNCTRLLRQVRA